MILLTVHTPFIVAAYSVVALGLVGLAWVSLATRQHWARRADALRREKDSEHG